MEVVYPRCCGLDIHKRTVVACRIVPGPDARPQQAVRPFGTVTDELLALAAWLDDAGVTHAALEATGVSWPPLWNLLEDRFVLLLVNAARVRQGPGRTTDVKAAEWLAARRRHGRRRASFVPPRPQRELRELTRYRTSLVRARSREATRIQKTLEGATLKLGDVASNVLGVSGQAILRALVAGTTDPAALADLARGRRRAERADLERALAGAGGPPQRFLLGEQLRRLAALDDSSARVSAEIAARARPVAAAREALDTIPGGARRPAAALVAEVGTDLSRFPAAAHLASWAGLCPGNHQSAGKRPSGRTRKANPWLRAALTEAAQGAGRTKQTYLGAQYRRLAARRGAKRAAVAVGHSILVIASHLLTTGEGYADPGPTSFDERARDAVQRRLVRRLEALGYTVQLQRPAA